MATSYAKYLAFVDRNVKVLPVREEIDPAPPPKKKPRAVKPATKSSSMNHFPGKKDRPDERDVEENPYTYDAPEDKVRLDSKVVMESGSHQYLLQDKKGIYANYILTCSSLSSYAKVLLVAPHTAVDFLKDRIIDKNNIVTLVASRDAEDATVPPRVTVGSRTEKMQLGTLFHWYSDRRIKEDITVARPALVMPECIQFDRFLMGLPVGYFNESEVCLGSLRHRICGQVDAFHRGEFLDYIWDWKNTSRLVDPEKVIVHKDVFDPKEIHKDSMITDRFYYTTNSEVSPGVTVPVMLHLNYDNIDTTMFQYMIQQGAYRKLRMLNGRPTSTFAYLGIVNRDLRRFNFEETAGLRVLQLDLSHPLPTRGGRSIAEIIQWVFDTNVEMLEKLPKHGGDDTSNPRVEGQTFSLPGRVD